MCIRDSSISIGRATELLETPLVRLHWHVRGGTAHPLHLRASFAQAERDFSSVGHTLVYMRTRLSVHKVEAVELVRWGCGLVCKPTDSCEEGNVADY